MLNKKGGNSMKLFKPVTALTSMFSSPKAQVANPTQTDDTTTTLPTPVQTAAVKSSANKLALFAQSLSSKAFQKGLSYWSISSDSEKAKERFVAITKPMLVGAASTACNLASKDPMIRQITRGAQIASLAWTAGKCVKAFFAPREAFVTRPDDQKKRDEMLQTLADTIEPAQSALLALKAAESAKPVNHGSINKHRTLVLKEIQDILSSILGREVRVSNPNTCFKYYSSMQQFLVDLYTRLEEITKPTGKKLKDPAHVIEAIREALTELQTDGSIVTVDMDGKVESSLAKLKEIVGRPMDVTVFDGKVHTSEIDKAMQELKDARLNYLNTLKPAPIQKKHWFVARYLDPVKTLVSGQKQTSTQGTTEAFAYLAFKDAIELFEELAASPIEDTGTQTKEHTLHTSPKLTLERFGGFDDDNWSTGSGDTEVLDGRAAKHHASVMSSPRGPSHSTSQKVLVANASNWTSDTKSVDSKDSE
jgi:hypothetical protein